MLRKPIQNHFPIEVARQNVNKGWEGHTPLGSNVTLLPHVVACRETSCMKDLRHEVYIWHRGGTAHHDQASEKAGGVRRIGEM